MPLNRYIDPKQYYSYKDWGQKVFDIANAGLDMAHSIKGGNIGGAQSAGNRLNNAIGDVVKNGANVNPQQTANKQSASQQTGVPGTAGATTGAGAGVTDTMSQALGNATNAGAGATGGAVPGAAPVSAASTDANTPLQRLPITTGLSDVTQGAQIKTNSSSPSGGGLLSNMSNNFYSADAGRDAGMNKASGIMGAIGGGSSMSFNGGGAGDAQGNMWSQAGKMYNQTNQAIVKMVGNQWKDDGQRIAYGDSTYTAPSRKDLEKKTNQYVKDLRGSTFYSNANNFDDLAKDINDPNNFVNVSKGATQKQKILGTAQRSLNASGKGAELGGKIGGFAGPMGAGIGTVAGAVIGGIAGIFGGAFGARRARRRLRKIQAAQRYANLSHDQQMQDSVSNLNQKNLNEAMANVQDYGGDLYTLGSFLKRQYGHSFADGGEMENRGDSIRSSESHWPGITEFNAGGSHEENPYGGILQGVAPDGAPNLVEEGEVKIGDIIDRTNQYILSARLMLDSETAREFNIPQKFVGLTFAEGFKKAYSPYKERQGNPEVRNEVAHLCDAFRQAQDTVKAKEEMHRQMAVLKSMSPEEQAMMTSMAAQEDAAAQEQMAADDMAAQQQMQEAPEQGMEEQAMQGPSMMQQGMPQEAAMDPSMMQQGTPMMSYGGRLSRMYERGGKMKVAQSNGEGEEEADQAVASRKDLATERTLQDVSDGVYDDWIREHYPLMVDPNNIERGKYENYRDYADHYRLWDEFYEDRPLSVRSESPRNAQLARNLSNAIEDRARFLQMQARRSQRAAEVSRMRESAKETPLQSVSPDLSNMLWPVSPEMERLKSIKPNLAASLPDVKQFSYGGDIDSSRPHVFDTGATMRTMPTPADAWQAYFNSKKKPGVVNYSPTMSEIDLPEITPKAEVTPSINYSVPDLYKKYWANSSSPFRLSQEKSPSLGYKFPDAPYTGIDGYADGPVDLGDHRNVFRRLNDAIDRGGEKLRNNIDSMIDFRRAMSAKPQIVSEEDMADENPDAQAWADDLADSEAVAAKFKADHPEMFVYNQQGQNSTPASNSVETPEEKRSRILNELGDGYYSKAQHLDKAGIIANARMLMDHGKYRLDADKYNNMTREGLGRSLVSSRDVGAGYRPQYINPDAENNRLASSAAQAIRSAANLSAGNRGASMAAVANIFNNANQQRGMNAYNAALENEKLRSDAWQKNKAIESENVKNHLSADQQNAATIRAAYDKMVDTTAGVDQYNKKLRFDLEQNLANLIAKYGKEARDRHMVNYMIANGLFGKGSENAIANSIVSGLSGKKGE